MKSNLKLYLTKELQSGMVSAQDVFDDSGSLIPLIRKDETLTNNVIAELRMRKVRAVYIKDAPIRRDPGRPGIDRPSIIQVPKPRPVVDTKLRSEALESLEDAFALAALDKENIHQSSTQIIRHVDAVVNQLVNSLQREPGALVNINDLKSYDEYTFHHSLSVAVLTIAIAQHMGFSQRDLNRIGMCAMMHDIGKTAVPLEIIHKPSRLDNSEFAIIKNHSPAGLEYLENTDIEDEDILRGVLHHHEKVDGTGYPHGIKGSEIPLWSRIISVADVYDALTSNRPYRDPMQPQEAIEYIMGGVSSAFDYDTVSAFVRKVELYPVGSKVELSNGSVALVLNNESQMRPIVQMLDNGDVVDLYRDRSYLNVVVTRLL
ncbi:MAG: HD-GYP domain-containing protein [Oscillospiraceae bacterium]|nr:HD-GYP domain-containing protein [Oscillospiraceae bacterium]